MNISFIFSCLVDDVGTGPVGECRIVTFTTPEIKGPNIIFAVERAAPIKYCAESKLKKKKKTVDLSGGGELPRLIPYVKSSSRNFYSGIKISIQSIP